MRIYFIALLALISQTIFASDKGNGGGVHLCPGNRVQLYDLYEAYTRYNFQMPKSNLEIDLYINRSLLKIRNLSPWLENKIKVQLSYLNSGHFLLRPNLNLFPIEDVNILAVDQGCSYQQLANWDDSSGNVLVKQEYFDSFTNLDKAGSLLHEAIYKVMRQENNQINSDLTRKLVGDALSVESKLFYIDDYKALTKDIISKDNYSRVVYEAKQNSAQSIQISYNLEDKNYYSSENLILKVRIEFKEIFEEIAKLDNLKDQLAQALEENKAIKSSRRSAKHYDAIIRPIKSQVDSLSIAVGSFRNGLKHDEEMLLKPGDRLQAIGFDALLRERPLHYKAKISVELDGREVASSELAGELKDGLMYSLEFKVTQNQVPVSLYP